MIAVKALENGRAESDSEPRNPVLVIHNTQHRCAECGRRTRWPLCGRCEGIEVLRENVALLEEENRELRRRYAVDDPELAGAYGRAAHAILPRDYLRTGGGRR